MSIKIFISSVQAEFAEERRKLFDYIQSDALLGRFFIPFIFENEPASAKSAQSVYLSQVAECDIYLGLFGCRYGYEDAEGISPTEREYDMATEECKHRLVFITRLQGRKKRHPKQAKLIAKAEQSVVRKSFSDYDELRSSVYESLVRYLEEQDYIRKLPFDASFCHGATLDDIDPEKVAHFVMLAKAHRGFPIPFSAGIPTILTHLRVMTDTGKLTNSAILLFGKRPQEFFPTSSIKCAQFYTSTVTKPLLSHYKFNGTIFEMIDKAVDFVMSRINVHVGTRAYSNTADVTCEIPRDAVTEAIVNAVVHRDYASNGSVEVRLFKDRLEVWNPGKLPYGVSLDKLRYMHSSIPVNPILAHPAYLAGYIEEMGTGTSDIIEKCLNHGLDTPEFIQAEEFRVVIWRERIDDDFGVNMVKENEETALYAWNIHQKRIKAQNALFANKGKRTNRVDVAAKQLAVEQFCSEPRSSMEIMSHIGVTRQTRTVNLYIGDLVKAGKLRLLIPDKPNSPHQRYISTHAGM